MGDKEGGTETSTVKQMDGVKDKKKRKKRGK